MKAAMHPSKELLVGLLGKLIISPAMMLVCALFFHISGLELSILVLCAAVPTAMNGYLITKKMGGDHELYAAIATVQTVLAFFTIPVILWLVKNNFGGV